MTSRSPQDHSQTGSLLSDTEGPARRRQGLSRFFSRSFGAGAVVVAVLVGIQLGSIPWRYRRQIWQLQGFLLGGLAGYVVGRLSRAGASSPGGAAGDRHRPGLPPPP
ncbi:hypothetical protein CPCC7001_1060 [Cyanobium sp. PCC 7001]|uniref:hypothetical protein n=1 Tax=Cyanobium sp. PCC 7001 TaxID=180281 RepID=UPI0001805423|nr:hypothetical protein [Cyanobium sp. PCC 7001]EDY38181.1 hypothetical protein CPCC7001_1060 [Cyanobium sp. PCC 7001]